MRGPLHPALLLVIMTGEILLIMFFFSMFKGLSFYQIVSGSVVAGGLVTLGVLLSSRRFPQAEGAVIIGGTVLVIMIYVLYPILNLTRPLHGLYVAPDQMLGLGLLAAVFVPTGLLVRSRRRRSTSQPSPTAVTPAPVAPAAPAAPEPLPAVAVPVPAGGIIVKRGGEVVGDRFEYKVKVTNNTKFVITNVNVSIIAYPDECLNIEGSTSKVIPRIEPGGFRSPQFVFVPTKDCVQGEILATVSYVDHKNKAQVEEVEPYTVRSVCDLLKPLEKSVEDFDLILDKMSVSTEEDRVQWNPKLLSEKVEKLLPKKNFHIIESKGETVGGTFKGEIRGLAEGKYTGKKIAVRIAISGNEEGDIADVVIEGLGEDVSMLPTTIHELSESIKSWTCMNCGAAFSPAEVDTINGGQPVQCKYCRQTMTLDLYRKHPSQKK